ncbi:MAG: hypothetical protein OEY49_18050, partial [Candidatus Heimdallarchaeota archaeon]|nr:hypothetical protein [Candidatus Heimdallarchaeota archaeon]
MITEKNDETNEDIPIEEMERIMELKYRRVYSERLARKVYVLIDWIEKPLFKKYKRLFGYTDIG